MITRFMVKYPRESDRYPGREVVEVEAPTCEAAARKLF